MLVVYLVSKGDRVEKKFNILTSIIYSDYALSGAHEAKEHATGYHHNPNYVITFELNWLLSCIYGFN